MLWLAARVKGKAISLMLNPVPVAEAWEMVTLLLPVFVSVADWLWLEPTCTFPKLILDGLVES